MYGASKKLPAIETPLFEADVQIRDRPLRIPVQFANCKLAINFIADVIYTRQRYASLAVVLKRIPAILSARLCPVIQGGPVEKFGNLLHRFALAPTFPHQRLLRVIVVNPASLFHLQHSRCSRSAHCDASTG
jgi:hypothetical protein